MQKSFHKRQNKAPMLFQTSFPFLSVQKIHFFTSQIHFDASLLLVPLNESARPLERFFIQNHSKDLTGSKNDIASKIPKDPQTSHFFTNFLALHLLSITSDLQC